MKTSRLVDEATAGPKELASNAEEEAIIDLESMEIDIEADQPPITAVV